MMSIWCRRLSPLPHGDDVHGVVWTCLHCCYTVFVHTLPGTYYCTLLGEESKTSSRVSGPCPMQSLCGQQRWKIIPHWKTTEVLLLSLLWTEIWEAGRNARGLGHGWAQNRSQCIDRPVLIPAYNCFCYFEEPLQRAMCSKTRNSKNPSSYCSKIPHPLLWTQGVHFHPASSCFLLVKPGGNNETTVKQRPHYDFLNK